MKHFYLVCLLLCCSNTMWSQLNRHLNYTYEAEQITDPLAVTANQKTGASVEVIGNRMFASQLATATILVYERANAAAPWVIVKRISRPDAPGESNFGSVIAAWNDYLVVGDEINGAFSFSSYGKVYVYHKDAGGIGNWGHVTSLVSPTPTTNGGFGISLDIEDNKIVVGARNEKKAYLFEKDNGGVNNWGLSKTFTTLTSSSLSFGESVLFSDNTLFIGGGWYASGYSTNLGEVCIYGKDTGGANNWGLIKSMRHGRNSFGSSLAVSGNTLVVGAPRNSLDTDPGNIFIFNKNLGGTNNWGLQQMRAPTNAAQMSDFGYGVAIDGDRIITRAKQLNSVTQQFYYFNRTTGGTDNWGQFGILLASDSQFVEIPKTAFNISGNEVYIGSTAGRVGGVNTGKVYRYSFDECFHMFTQLYDTIYYDEAIAFGNDVLRYEGVYEHVIPKNDGCDSTLVMNLEVASRLNFHDPFGFAGGDGVFDVTLGDINGDGKLDMVTANYLSGNISVFQNQTPTGVINPATFRSSFPLPAGIKASSVKIADVDGDGKKDIISTYRATNAANDSVFVYRNIGAVGGIMNAAYFAPKVGFQVGNQPVGMDVADLDGDGLIDIAVNNLSTMTISLLRNESTPGTIAFATKLDLTIGGANIANATVRLEDVNNDGKPDIVTTSSGNGRVIVAENASVVGGLNFLTSFPVYSFGGNPGSVSVADFDNDGCNDIAQVRFRNENQILFLESQCNTTLNAANYAQIPIPTVLPIAPVYTGYMSESADFDLNGQPDIFYTDRVSNTSGRLRFFANVENGNGAIEQLDFHKDYSKTYSTIFSGIEYVTGFNTPVNIAVGDIDNDGLDDVCVINFGEDKVWVFKNGSLIAGTQVNGTVTSTVNSGNAYCSNEAINVSANSNTAYTSNNSFVVQLSDNTGNFSSPFIIGTVNGTTLSSFDCTIPANVPYGTGYRVRVVSTSPHIIGNDNGFDITISPSSSQTQTVVACGSYTWPANGVSYFSSATVTEALTNTIGCDSTITLNLTINQPSSSAVSVTACGSYTLNGTTYNSSGTYTQIISNAANCDSLITLNLLISQPSSSTVSATACGSYTLNGTTYNSSGTYTQIISNAANCDSVITLNLLIRQATSSTVSITSCGSYTLNGTTYNSSGTYTQVIPNAANCDSIITLNLTIGDVVAPVFNSASLPDVTAQCSVTSLTAPTATDNCAGIITGTHNATLPITTLGTTVVTWTYNDGNGNSSTQTQNVIISDNVAPVANVSSLPAVTAQCSVTSLTAPTATDNCAGIITGTHNASLPITTLGTTVVTWTYDDGNGNASTQTQNVIVSDNTAPVANVSSLPNVTAQCSIMSLTSPTATDNCAGAITGTHNVSLPITTLGTTVVTWTYNDGNGNTSTQTQNVIISDNTAPVANVSSLPNVTAQCSVTSLTAPTATDNCAGTITGTHNATLPITTLGTTVVTWTYDDGNGNASTQTQNVIVSDNTAPVANTPNLADVTAQCSVTSLTAPTATDNCAGIIIGTHNATLPITTLGTTVVTWTYNDGNGNSSTQTQNVIISDNTAPVANVSSLPNITAQCSVTSLTAPTATDNCAGTITGTHNATLPITTLGTTVVTWTYNDGNGNSSTQTQNVNILDNTAPVANVSSLPDVTTQCSVASLTAPTATDNCAGIITGTHNAILPLTTLGTTVVTWTYNDGNGNTSTQTQNVIISDNTAPVADVSSLPNVTAQCSVTSLTAPTATDNCAGIITGTHSAILPITTLGTTVVTWTYNDGNGNSSTQTQNVIISDNTAPVADVSSLPNVTAQCSVTSLTAPTATDNCAGIITGTHNATLPITTLGTTVVTWTYNDGNGNTSTQTQNVIISDNVAPVANVSSLPDVTGQCSVTSLTASTATDNCAGTITGTHNAILPITTLGTTVVTWTYNDGNGNTSTQTQNVIISDNTAPVANVSSLPNVTAQCSVTSLTSPTATDNCAGIITGTHNAILPITTLGTTVVTWTYNDGNGNTSTQTQSVIVSDNTAPVANVSSLPDVTGQCSVASLTAPTATDNCAGIITGTHNATLPITTLGTTVVTWTYNDGNGNTSTQTQNVIVSDNIAPVANVSSLPDVTAQCSVTSLTAPTATDNCAGTITGTHNASLPITTLGTTVVTWTYNDGNGNTSTQTQNVILSDNTAPVANVSSLPNITAQCSVTSLTAPTATDNCAGIITGAHNASLPITTLGTTVVTWTYNDGNGNSSTQTQNVIISDNTAPVANTPNLADVTAQCSVTSLTAPTATDNCAGIITGTHNAILPLTTLGTTVVTWTYNDGNGNTSTQTQNVIISDNTAPVADVSSLPNVTAQCSVTSLTAPTATDNCAGIITGTHNATLPITTLGTTVVTWTYNDGNGNTSTQTQNVIVSDNTAPVANVSSLPDVTAQCSVTSLTAPTATDNCAGVITGTHNASLPITTLGTTVVTWTYNDGNGNTSTQTQNVIVSDNTAPVVNVSSLPNITAQCSVTSLTAPTATDNCAGIITGTHNATLPITTLGTTVVIWTYNDGNGNTSTQTQNVIITAPVATTTLNGATLTATTSGATYQWIDCRNGNTPMPGATAQSFTVPVNGTYAVIVTQNGCSATSPCVKVLTVGLDDLTKSFFAVYPNPNNGVFRVVTEVPLTIRVSNAAGQEVLSQMLEAGENSLELPNAESGIYLIRATDSNGQVAVERISVIK